MVRLSRLCLVAAGTLFAAILAPHAAAYRYQVLHAFCPLKGCPDGSGPYGGLLMDVAGNLYGTASFGGANNAGAVFELRLNAARPGWTETVLYSFCSRANCTDGATPYAGLIMDRAGHLYGTTLTGGGGISRGGVVFELTRNPGRTTWTETVLYSFCSESNCADGSGPAYGRLLMDPAGNLYGTTQNGGNAAGDGVVFKLTRAAGRWRETVLWTFCRLGRPCVDGGVPQAGLIMDKSGNLYGTTLRFGSANSGVVFKVTPHRSETVLYDFSSSVGADPVAGLIMDGSGKLYGTTTAGGAQGQGSVYELTPAGATWKARLLYGFCARTLCADGAQPWAGLTLDGAGNLYGTTELGSAHGHGVVFQLAPFAASPTGFIEKVLYAFCSQRNCPDGSDPIGDVIRDRFGNLYGTTVSGGANGDGVVFELVRP
jgi:uncharacterized repeat protein (TIGR03803 family)